jgi:hypothetical protein
LSATPSWIIFDSGPTLSILFEDQLSLIPLGIVLSSSPVLASLFQVSMLEIVDP